MHFPPLMTSDKGQAGFFLTSPDFLRHPLHFFSWSALYKVHPHQLVCLFLCCPSVDVALHLERQRFLLCFPVTALKMQSLLKFYTLQACISECFLARGGEDDFLCEEVRFEMVSIPPRKTIERGGLQPVIRDWYFPNSRSLSYHQATHCVYVHSSRRHEVVL